MSILYHDLQQSIATKSLTNLHNGINIVLCAAAHCSLADYGLWHLYASQNDSVGWRNILHYVCAQIHHQALTCAPRRPQWPA